MTRPATALADHGDPAVTGDQILGRLRDVMLAAGRMNARFQERIAGAEGHPMAAFALHDLLLSGRRGLPQVEMARTLQMSASSATRLIDALEANDVVRREPHPNDRRINQVVLTVVGKALIMDLLADIERRGAELGLRDPAALSQFSGQLTRFTSVVG